jgi:thioredoxin-related protein
MESMRDSLVLLVVALVVAGAYGYHNNPTECRKLGVDIVADTKAIFLTPDSAKGTTDASPVAGTAPSVPVVSPGPAAAAPVVAPNPAPAAPVAAVTQPPAVPVVAPTPPPPHYSVGFVAQDAAPAPGAATPATAAPTTAVPTATVPATVTPGPAPSANLTSLTDYEEAIGTARSHHVPMLILFTGSDWCQYCQKLQQEVLSDSGFQSYTGSHYVLLTVDDLRNTPVSDSDKQRVQGLEQKFHVAGFPTLIMVDRDEHEMGRIEGYDPGSEPSAVTKRLDQIAQQADHP